MKPYANNVTKYGSKCIAATVLSSLTAYSLFNLEERRVDNFAIEHSNASMLQGAIQIFETIKKSVEDEYGKKTELRKIPDHFVQQILDPLAPSLDSRIAKCKKALQKQQEILNKNCP